MIISMGIDIVEIEEIKESIEKNKRFLKRVFTPQEISYCEGKSNKYASYASRFAVKEAVMKALGIGWDNGVQWKQIEVIHGDRRPETGDGKEVSSKQLEVNSNGKRCSEIGDRKLPIANSQKLTANSQSGKPEIKLTGKALQITKEMGVENIFLSLSHSKCNAVASVVFEGNRRQETADRNPRIQEPTANC